MKSISAEELKPGDKLANPKTGEHVSTVVDVGKDWFQIGTRDMHPKEERVVLTVKLNTGREVVRDVSPNYTFEIIEEE